ncbi:MAG: signal recognition particle-docking protein FtsY [bacterium]|nr:signal recognition particle-docking protein FtsY [bacterium]
MNLLKKLKDTLQATRQKLGGQLLNIFSSHQKIDDELFDELEEALISADVGLDTTQAIMSSLREKVRKTAGTSGDPQIVKDLLVDVIAEIITPPVSFEKPRLDHKPSVILVVGVNGSGKTTTIAKLADYYQRQEQRVLLAAADTFRAAAAEQLLAWGDRVGVQVIRQQSGADPAAVAFDALQSARARQFDLLIIDTAGRLHNKTNLMQELAKITRVLKKQDPEAPHEVFLVLDGTTGQNAVQQAKVFQEICGVTGIIIAKLDGTAKGGAVLAICRELHLPLRFIGTGEKLEDLEEFDPLTYAKALFEIDETPV